MMPEGKVAGDVCGGEEPTPPRHITLRALMGEGAFDINTTPCRPRGWRALWFALGVEDEPIDEVAVKLVLDASGLNIHVTNRRGSTVLGNQCSWGRSRNVELLLADGRIDPNQRDAEGQTPLRSAASLGEVRCVELLLADGRVDPNQRDAKGKTPLCIAANLGKNRCVELLLADPRVDPNLCARDGYTPLNIAANTGADG
jgi:ankyrin repeat protein